MPDEPNSSSIGIVNSNLGAELQSILDAEDLQPGSEPSYSLCKALYVFHPLGGKLAESPIRMAQSQDRDITVAGAPERVIEAWTDEWERLGANGVILSVATQARVYGLTSVALGITGEDEIKSKEPIDLKTLWKENLFFNVLDPLNTSGLIVNQDPNSPGYQRPRLIRVNGRVYHSSRTVTVMNEGSLYIAWTTSAFAYAGRSVYQRALYPLKTFLQTMITDDMVSRKAGVLIAKMESPGSIIDRITRGFYAIKRAFLRAASTNNVVSIGLKEDISSLNLQNLDGPMALARNNAIKNIASAADMPAKLLTQEAYVEGFGEGTEDAKAVAAWIDRYRIELAPIYAWFDLITMYRAWNEDFYKTIQESFPEEYGKVDYQTAFYKWRNAFKATWPNLLKEEPSELVQVDDVRLKALIAVVQVMAPLMDPTNRAAVIQFAVDIINTREELFGGAQLNLDMDELTAYIEEQVEQQKQAAMNPQQEEGTGKPPVPFSSHDSQPVNVAEWLGVKNDHLGRRRAA